jgi:hypothetical protein
VFADDDDAIHGELAGAEGQGLVDGGVDGHAMAL